MSVSAGLVRAVARKELAEYRRTGSILAAMAVLPLVFIVQPLVIAIRLPPGASGMIAHGHVMLFLLAIPALVPALLAAYAVVGERQRGTLEPVLTTPVSRDELVLGKALAAFAPSVVVAYAVYGIFVAVVEIAARPGVAPALVRGPDVLAQVLFTPPLAAWSIWLGLAVSTRARDVRVAQQLGLLASLPSAVVTSLVAFGVIPVSPALVIAAAAALAAGDALGWRAVCAMFDRERLVTSGG